MNLNSIRLRLTAGYVGIFALLVLLLGVVAIFGFSRELTKQNLWGAIDFSQKALHWCLSCVSQLVGFGE
jgi:hypothetical protein